MNIQLEEKIRQLEQKKRELSPKDRLYKEIDDRINDCLQNNLHDLDPWDRINLARASNRPKAQDYIPYLFTDFL